MGARLRATWPTSWRAAACDRRPRPRTRRGGRNQACWPSELVAETLHPPPSWAPCTLRAMPGGRRASTRVGPTWERLRPPGHRSRPAVLVRLTRWSASPGCCRATPRALLRPRSKLGAGRRPTTSGAGGYTLPSVAAGTKTCSAGMTRRCKRPTSSSTAGGERGSPGLLGWAHLARLASAPARIPTRLSSGSRSAEAYVEALDGRVATASSSTVIVPRRCSTVDLLAAAATSHWCLSSAPERTWTPGMLIAAVPHVVVALARLGDSEAAGARPRESLQRACGTLRSERLDSTAHELRIELGDQFDELTRRGKELSIVELTDLALEAAAAPHRRRSVKGDRSALTRGARPSSRPRTPTMSAPSMSSLVAPPTTPTVARPVARYWRRITPK